MPCIVPLPLLTLHLLLLFLLLFYLSLPVLILIALSLPLIRFCHFQMYNALIGFERVVVVLLHVIDQLSPQELLIAAENATFDDVE